MEGRSGGQRSEKRPQTELCLLGLQGGEGAGLWRSEGPLRGEEGRR